MIIRDLTDGPLCPNGLEPVHEAHQLRNRVLNAFYNAADKDADGELPEPLEKAYSAAAYEGSTAERMRLYTESASFVHAGEIAVVESWWFRCGICGLILPAQRTQR